MGHGRDLLPRVLEVLALVYAVGEGHGSVPDEADGVAVFLGLGEDVPGVPPGGVLLEEAGAGDVGAVEAELVDVGGG